MAASTPVKGLPATVKGRIDHLIRNKEFPVEAGLGSQSAKLAFILLSGVPGDEINDDELKQAVGFSCAPGDIKGYGHYYTAARRALSQNIVWQRVRGEGRIKCLDPNERVRWGVDRQKRVHTASVVTTKVISSINHADLTETNRPRAAALQTQSAIVSLITSPDSTRSLESASMARIQSTMLAETEKVAQGVRDMINGIKKTNEASARQSA